MSAPTSQVTIGGVDVSGYCTLGASGLGAAHGYAPEGRNDLVLSDGTLVRQQFFHKRTISIAGSGTIPPGLIGLNTSAAISVSIPDGDGGTLALSIWATITQNDSLNAGADGARHSWAVTGREE